MYVCTYVCTNQESVLTRSEHMYVCTFVHGSYKHTYVRMYMHINIAKCAVCTYLYYLPVLFALCVVSEGRGIGDTSDFPAIGSRIKDMQTSNILPYRAPSGYGVLCVFNSKSSVL